MHLYAAIVSEQTDEHTWTHEGLGKAVEQMKRLRKFVRTASDTIKEMRKAHPKASYQCVFLAPEYFFSNRRYESDRFFSEDVKKKILQDLAALAKDYPDILIIPGTILWTKNAYDGPDDAAVANPERVQKVKDRQQQANAKFGTTIDGAGWGHSVPLGGHTVDGLLDRAHDWQVKIAQNVAYVCLNDTMLKYRKVGNYEEVMDETGMLVFAPGSIVGRFEVGAVKYGLEICMDNALGALNSSVAGMGKVHVRLIVSSFVDFDAADQGAPVTLHASTAKAGRIMLETQPDGTQESLGRIGTTDMDLTGKDPAKLEIQTIKTNQVRFASGQGARVAAGFKTNPVKKDALTVWALELDEGKMGIANTSRTPLTSKDAGLSQVTVQPPPRRKGAGNPFRKIFGRG